MAELVQLMARQHPHVRLSMDREGHRKPAMCVIHALTLGGTFFELRMVRQRFLRSKVLCEHLC